MCNPISAPLFCSGPSSNTGSTTIPRGNVAKRKCLSSLVRKRFPYGEGWGVGSVTNMPFALSVRYFYFLQTVRLQGKEIFDVYI